MVLKLRFLNVNNLIFYPYRFIYTKLTYASKISWQREKYVEMYECQFQGIGNNRKFLKKK